jgi:hypothetical protein
MKYWLMFAVLVIALRPTYGQAPCVGMEAGSQQKQQGKNHTSASANDQRGTQCSPLVVDVKPSPKSDQETAEERRGKNRKEFIDRWTLRLAFALAATAILQVVGLGFQIGIYNRQTEIMNGSLLAATTSARAAMGVAVPTLAIRSFQIVPEHPFDDDVVATIKKPRISVVIKNHGQSPAFLKSYSLMLTCDPVESLPVVPDYSLVFYTEEFVVEPDSTHGVGYNFTYLRDFTSDDVLDLLSKTKHLTVYGIFTYGNIFDSSVKDLKFCKRLEDYGSEKQWRPVILDEKRLPQYVNA